jgi:hypothetical protein
MNDSFENIQSQHSNYWFVISVAGTVTKLILGLDEIFLNQAGILKQISKIEDLFQNSFLIEWFYAFCSSRTPYLSISSSRSIHEPPMQLKIATVQFSPSNPLHWNTFCKYFFFLDHQICLDLTLDTVVNGEEEEDSLKEACKQQFNDFIQNELQILLLQLQSI